MREQIFANQKKLGVIPADAQLTPWPDDLPKWDSLTPDQKKVFARQAEVYAGYTAYSDHEIGRVIQAVEDIGKLDNTLVIYIDGDNGTSPEGTLVGTSNQWRAYNGILDEPITEQLKVLDAWGSDKTYPHMAVAWSWAFDTPFKWTKQIASHFGGTRQGLAISWPGHIDDPGGIRTQFHHVIDIVPTILEATGIPAPDTVNGIQQKPIEGVSMAYTFKKANAAAPSTRSTQYFEMIANRGIYHDGWYACTTPPHGPWILNAPMPAPEDYKWELYHLSEDYSQYNDLAAKMPDKLKEMQQLFVEEAKKYNVFPLDNDTFARSLAPRPSATAGQTVFTYSGVVPGIPIASSPSFIAKSYTITAEVDCAGGWRRRDDRHQWRALWRDWLVPAQRQAGVRLQHAHSAQYRWAGKDALSAGKHTIVFDYTYDGPGLAKSGTGVLKVDGKVVDTEKQANSIAFLQVADETFDVGIRSPHRSKRCRLQGAIPIHRHDRQADLQTRTSATYRRGQQEGCGRNRKSRGLT